MLLDGVVQNRFAVMEPWKTRQSQANSLMQFRIGISIVNTTMMGLIIGLSLLIALGDIRDEQFGSGAKTVIIVAVVLWLLVIAASVMTNIWLHDFVVPIMYQRRLHTLPAYVMFLREIVLRYQGPIRLFYVMKLLIGLAVIAITALLMCLTLCLAGTPSLRSVILLPIFVFSRCYSLYMLQQFGLAWQILPEYVCASCDYDLRGSLGRPTCPECGAPIAAPA